MLPLRVSMPTDGRLGGVRRCAQPLQKDILGCVLLQQWRRKAAGAGDHQSSVSRMEVQVQNTICMCKIAGEAGSIHLNVKPVPVRDTINPIQPK